MSEHRPTSAGMPAGRFHGCVGVAYAQIYLQDRRPGDPPDWADFFRGRVARPVGLIDTKPGRAIMITGLHTGVVDYTVTVDTRDPGPRDDEYEDIVEIDFEARTPDVDLVQWAGEGIHPLPRLAAGAGSYRLRYHARGMDAAHRAGFRPPGQEPIDAYLLQIWPAPPSPPEVRKLTSAQARYRQSRKDPDP